MENGHWAAGLFGGLLFRSAHTDLQVDEENPKRAEPTFRPKQFVRCIQGSKEKWRQEEEQQWPKEGPKLFPALRVTSA